MAWKILAKIKFAFLYWLGWLIFFEIARLIFVSYNFGDSKHYSFKGLTQTFLYGLRMDASMASYIVLPVCIFLAGALFSGFFLNRRLYKVYTLIILLPVLLVILCDLPAYQAWGNRLDATALKYLSYPKEAWASVSHLPVFWFLIFFCIAFFLIYKKFKKIIDGNADLLNYRANKIFQLLAILIFAGLQILPLRGGIQLAPLNQSSVYFSTHNFLNLTAINAPWNFMHSLFHNTASSVNPYAYLDSNAARLRRDSLLHQHGITEKLVDLSATPKPNIILIVWESFTEKATHVTKDGHMVTPGFNQLKKEGVYFSNIYATGDRTDKGIPGILSGYPAQPITSIIKSPQKSVKLPMLPQLFRDRGYYNSFYYGGELEFANMKTYLSVSGYQDFISKEDFDKRDHNSKWGAHDHVVKNKLLADLGKKGQPFFATWLTLSSHEPYETPVNTVIRGGDDESLFLNSIHYSDSVVYEFIDQCKRQTWWNNTLVVIIADHGHLLPRTGSDIDRFKIPMLWLGGALLKKGIEVNKTASQVDLPAILIQQAGFTENPFIWSKDILKSEAQQWAYFSFNNGFGYVMPDRYLIYDNTGKMIRAQKGNISRNDLKNGQALQQTTFQDYLNK